MWPIAPAVPVESFARKCRIPPPLATTPATAKYCCYKPAPAEKTIDTGPPRSKNSKSGRKNNLCKQRCQCQKPKPKPCHNLSCFCPKFFLWQAPRQKKCLTLYPAFLRKYLSGAWIKENIRKDFCIYFQFPVRLKDILPLLFLRRPILWLYFSCLYFRLKLNPSSSLLPLCLLCNTVKEPCERYRRILDF